MGRVPGTLAVLPKGGLEQGPVGSRTDLRGDSRHQEMSGCFPLPWFFNLVFGHSSSFNLSTVFLQDLLEMSSCRERRKEGDLPSRVHFVSGLAG